MAQDQQGTAKLLDGKEFARRLRAGIAQEVSKLKAEHNITPGLAVVIVGDNPASRAYVANKHKSTIETGMASFRYELPESTSQQELMALVAELNAREDVQGILVQLPLPQGLDANAVIEAIKPEKDVDGFHVENAGMLSTGTGKPFVPCTPLGSLLVLRDHLGSLSGLNAVIIGRSNIVGKPMAQLLLNEGCTVTICHSKTRNIQEITKQADIVVAAVGRAQMVKADWIKKGATVIDVGINRVPKPDDASKSILVGDVDTQAVAAVAGAITPVPGGIGPMTIACLLANTMIACLRKHGFNEPDLLSLVQTQQ